jgi:hypothetical protein
LVLGANGWLPIGRHVVTPQEFQEHFVAAFPESKTRGRLFRRWERHLEALTSVIAVEAQWIDGSFVTSKLDPSDIDMVSVLDGPTFDALPAGLRSMVEGLLAGKATKAVWGLDSFAVLRYPDGSPFKAAADAAADEWHQFWQGDRGHDGSVKGYLEVIP